MAETLQASRGDVAEPEAARPAPAHWLAAWLMAGVVALAGVLLFRLWSPAGPSTCLMYNVLGIPCPGCGMTRSAALLARGDVVASLRMHPLGVVLAAQAVIAWAWWGLVLAGRARRPSPWWGIVPLSLDLLALGLVWLARFWMGTLPP